MCRFVGEYPWWVIVGAIVTHLVMVWVGVAFAGFSGKYEDGVLDGRAQVHRQLREERARDEAQEQGRQVTWKEHRLQGNAGTY